VVLKGHDGSHPIQMDKWQLPILPKLFHPFLIPFNSVVVFISSLKKNARKMQPKWFWSFMML